MDRQQDRDDRIRTGREPFVPADITGRELPKEIRSELKTLTKDQEERVSRHLVQGMLIQDTDPELSLDHFRWATRFGARAATVREMYGVRLYGAGEYRAAIRELRAAMRMNGRNDMLPIIADCERGLGRPERALDVAAQPEAESLSESDTIELMIVVAGAYADMGDIDLALASLDIPALRQKVNGQWQVRLWVAYSDLLEKAGRSDEAIKWLTLAADADTNEITDAGERLGRPSKVQAPVVLETDEQIGVMDVLDDFLAEEREREREAADDAARSEDTAEAGADDDAEPAEDSEMSDPQPSPEGAGTEDAADIETDDEDTDARQD
ncbi:tetratricopeptide repeat protein [Helcobacillus sp. ACRRO]|uniref:tetratricopeptide repeat protein n=1 Tax=Helcobacillus sp. ACRRO TaxID=2918202 RepID=UPI001EF4565A|nr:tetratricopeptide repeat protein [Helcobacillus sp. ACRRO]